MDINKLKVGMWVMYREDPSRMVDAEVMSFDVETGEVVVRHNTGESTKQASDLIAWVM
jgi:hypothetical protein